MKKPIRKTIYLAIALVGFISNALSQELTPEICSAVTERIEDRLVEQVDSGEISAEMATLRLTITETTCYSMAREGASVAELQEMFQPLSIKECRNVSESLDLEEVLAGYSVGAKVEAAQILTYLCRNAAFDKKVKLEYLIEVYKKLQEWGVQLPN